MRVRRGLTIIELLVSLFVVAILVGMLLPSLGGPRDLARRTQCQNHLRQLHHAHTMYLMEQRRFPALNRERNEGTWQFNYLIRDDNRQDYNFGPLRLMAYIEVPEVLYCPVQEHPFFTMNTPENPWVGRVVSAEHGAAPLMLAAERSRAGYGRRFGLSGKSYSDLNSGTALAADVLHLPEVIRSGHEDGLNAVYGDGHASWVADPGLFTDNELSKPFDVADNPTVAEIWKAIDRGG